MLIKPDSSAPAKTRGSPRGTNFDKTLTTMDESAKASGQRMEFVPNRSFVSIQKSDLLEKVQSPQKGRRSASCGGSPCFSAEVSELKAYSFKSDQASIADWVELFEKNECLFGDEVLDENFFNLIN